MRSHTYSKFSPEAADAVDLQALLGKLADFLLQSGFAGGQQFDPWGDYNEETDRSLEALKQAILDALIESGQFTPELLEALRGDGDDESEDKLARLLDELVQRRQGLCVAACLVIFGCRRERNFAVQNPTP